VILTNKNTFLTPVGSRVITPGQNVIPDDEFDVIKKTEFAKDQIKLGKWVPSSSGVKLEYEDPEEVEPETEEDALIASASEISNMDTKSAVKLIIGEEGADGILDINVLEELKKMDARKGIQKAIKAQIDFLTSDEEEEEEEAQE